MNSEDPEFQDLPEELNAEDIQEALAEIAATMGVVPDAEKSTAPDPDADGPLATKLARVAIVGRPNVGKSTLLNRLMGSRVSIVEPTEGVTRDRVVVRAELPLPAGVRFVEILDTGGIGIVDRDDLGPHVEEQVRAAMLTADLVLFMVDVRTGITPLDREVAARLRKLEVSVLLVVNKAEGERQLWGVDEFRRLGIPSEPLAISAQNGEGMTDLLSAMEPLLPVPTGVEKRLAPTLRVAIIGRRNAGKSTLTNALANEERMIVSEIPGTTRDAVDVVLERDGETIVVIDTAGVRKKASFADAIEFFSDARSHRAIRRADVVILLFDAMEPLAGIEKRLARYVVDHHRPVILAANKWDTVGQQMTSGELTQYLRDELPGLLFAPVATLSAKSGQGVDELFGLARQLYSEAGVRVSTGDLNRSLDRALAARPPSRKGYMMKVTYATQADRRPPTFVLFVNDRRLFGKDVLRYLENRMRMELPFPRVPLRLVLRDKRAAPLEDL